MESKSIKIKEFEAILGGLLENRKKFGNSISRFEAWFKLQSEILLLMEAFKKGSNLTVKQTALFYYLKNSVEEYKGQKNQTNDYKDIAAVFAEAAPKKNKDNNNNIALDPTKNLSTLNTGTLLEHFYSKPETETKSDHAYKPIDVPHLHFSSKDGERSLKNWANYRKEQRNIKACDDLIDRLIEPTRNRWSYFILPLILTILFGAGSALSLLGYWLAILPLSLVIVLLIPTFIANTALADQFLLLVAICKIGFYELVEHFSYYKRKASNTMGIFKVLGIILLIIISIVSASCLAIVYGFLIYASMLLVFPTVGIAVTSITTVPTGVFIFTILLIASTALVIVVFSMPDFFNQINSFLDKSKSPETSDKKFSWSRIKYYLLIPFFIIGLFLLHVAVYPVLLVFFGPVLAILICSFSLLASSFFAVKGGGKILQGLFSRQFFIFFRGVISCIKKHFSNLAEGKSRSKALFYYTCGFISNCFVVAIGIPFFFVVSALVFIIKRASNHDELLEIWLLKSINRIAEKTKEYGFVNWVVFLSVGIFYFAFVFLPVIVITTLFLGETASPERAWERLILRVKAIKSEWDKKNSGLSRFGFLLNKVFVGLLYIVILSFMFTINCIALAWGTVLYVVFVFRGIKNALNNGVPGLVAIIGAGSVPIGKLAIGIAGFISSSFNSLATMSKNTLFKNKHFLVKPVNTKKQMDQYFDKSKAFETKNTLFRFFDNEGKKSPSKTIKNSKN